MIKKIALVIFDNVSLVKMQFILHKAQRIIEAATLCDPA